MQLVYFDPKQSRPYVYINFYQVRIINIKLWILEQLGKPPREQCCKDAGVSQECLVLCRKDPNVGAPGSSDDFPNDTPCEKHKTAINKCAKEGGIWF